MNTSGIIADSGTAPRAGGPAPPRLEISRVTKWYAGAGRDAPRELVLDDISLAVRAGEFAALVGPSGAGKSTLLTIIAGLDEPDSGSVLLDGDPAGPRLGRVAYMQQRDLLLPWRTVLDNARLGLELQGTPRAEANRHVSDLAEKFGLARVLSAHPWRLSGGMRQRAALLRSVLPARGVLLLDEPFGALDAITRASLQVWLGEVLDRSDRAVLFVTHDVEEAVLLADRVYVLSAQPGRIVASVDVDLPRPRPQGIVTTDRFVEVKRRLLGLLQAHGEAAP